MTFFTKEYFKFFSELEKNNNKVWFDAHRDTYETSVKVPFRKFTEHIIKELSKTDKTILQDASKCIFRINKDIRFSKDKSPYKLNLAAVFGKNGKNDDHNPSFYVHIGHKEIFIGGGLYMISKDDLTKIRQEIYYNPKEFEAVLKHKDFKKYYGKIEGEKNKVLPEDYRDFVKEQPYIANKQFYTGAVLTQADVLAKDFDKTVLAHFKAVLPLNNFINKALAE